MSQKSNDHGSQLKQGFNRLCLALCLLWSMPLPAASIQVALTFDDLPSIWDEPPSGYTNAGLIDDIIQVLAKHKVEGVYAFVNAGRIRTDADKRIIDSWVRHGHRIANHTWLHRDLNTSDPAEFIAEIQRNDRYLATFGARFSRFFRYPFLHEGNSKTRRSVVRNHLASSGYTIAQVTIDHNDWAWYIPFSRCHKINDSDSINVLRGWYDAEALANLRAAELLSAHLFGRSVKHVALMHPNVMTADRLDTTLRNWKKNGVEFISLDEASRDPVYSIDPGIVSDSPGLFTNQIRIKRGLQNPAEVREIFKQTEAVEKALEAICAQPALNP